MLALFKASPRTNSMRCVPSGLQAEPLDCTVRAGRIRIENVLRPVSLSGLIQRSADLHVRIAICHCSAARTDMKSREGRRRNTTISPYQSGIINLPLSPSLLDQALSEPWTCIHTHTNDLFSSLCAYHGDYGGPALVKVSKMQQSVSDKYSNPAARTTLLRAHCVKL